MGIDYAAVHCTVIADEKLSALCPQEYNDFIRTIKYYGVCEQDVYQYFAYDDAQDMCDNLTERFYALYEDSYTEEELETLLSNVIESCQTDIQESWDRLNRAFCLQTTVNGYSLTLYYGYHSPDEGCRGDTIEGQYFGVFGVYSLTEPGRKFQHLWTEESYVQWG